MKKYIFSLSVLFLCGCAVTDPNLPKIEGDLVENGPKGLSYEGVYYGVRECDDCKGIDTWLKIYTQNNRSYYELSEKFLGKENRKINSAIKWLKNGSVASLLESGYFVLLSNGSASFVSSSNAKANLKNRLSKYDEYRFGDKMILINPEKIQAGKMNGGTTLKFTAVTNLDKADNDGVKSFRTTYLINCKKNQILASRMAFYSENFTAGSFVYPKQKDDFKWQNINSNSLLGVTKEALCK